MVCHAPEKVDFEKKAGVVIEPLNKKEDLGDLLERGEIDALFFPHPPHSVLSGRARPAACSADTKAEELRYFRKYGYFPSCTS